MDAKTHKYTRIVSKLESRVQSLERANQTGYGSIEGGRSIEIRDVSGELIGTVGGQDDGSVGTVDLVPVAPPAPTRAEAVAGVESVVVRWDGGYDDIADPQVTVAYVGVHMNQNPDDPAWVPTVSSELQQITPGGGEVMLSGDSGVETDVVLVAVSAAGVWSVPTVPVSVTPTYAVDIDVVGELVEEVELVKTDGLPPATAPVFEVVKALGRLVILIAPPPNADPLTAYTVYVNSAPVVSALSSSIDVSVDAAGAKLLYDIDSIIQVSASDADGEGPLSDPVASRPLQLVSTDITPGSITATEIANFAIPAIKIKSTRHEIF